MLIILILALEALMIWEFRRRVLTPTGPLLIMFFVLAAQILFSVADYVGYADIAGPDSLLSFRHDRLRGVLLYFAIFMIAYAATLRVTHSERDSLVGAVRAAFERISSYNGYLLLLLIPAVAIHVNAIPKDQLYLNFTYQSLTDVDYLGVSNPLSRFVIALTFPLSVMALYVFSSFLFSRNWWLMWISLPLAGWYMIFYVAICSRSSAVVMAIPMFMAFVILKRNRLLMSGLFGMLSLACLVMALKGRSLGVFGVSMIPEYINQVVDLSGADIVFTIFNLFQGIFSTTDGLSLHVNYPTQYILLSFSPFPSFIDGFAKIKDLYQVRASLYSPMSAIAEIIKFGNYSVIFASILFFWTMRFSVLMLKVRNPNMAMLSGVGILVLFIIASAYPTRNAARLLYIILIALFVSYNWAVSKLQRSYRAPTN